MPHKDSDAAEPPTAEEPAGARARAEALAAYDILDTPAEQEYDDVVRLASEVLQVAVGLVGFLDGNRLWFKAAFGWGAPEIPSAEMPFCAHAAALGTTLVVEDARTDERFATAACV